jgi:hypothetical protein
VENPIGEKGGRRNSMKRLAGLMLIAGSAMFLVAVFSPIYLNVFGSIGNPTQQIEYLEGDRNGWTVATTMTAIGGLLPVIGLTLFARHLQLSRAQINIRIACYLAAVMAAAGALFWLVICYYRIILPSQDLILDNRYPDWFFVVYSLLTATALIVIGFVLLQRGYPKWLVLVMLLWGGLELIVYLVLKDLPPVVHYLPLLIMGIALLFASPNRMSQEKTQLKESDAKA